MARKTNRTAAPAAAYNGTFIRVEATTPEAARAFTAELEARDESPWQPADVLASLLSGGLSSSPEDSVDGFESLVNAYSESSIKGISAFYAPR
jgi:hypothetical protein